MAKLTLPIPSPVPLDVLAMPIDTLLKRVPTERPRSSAIVTRFGNVCRNNGIGTVWSLAINSRQRLLKLRNCSDGITNFAEQVLELVGCSFGMFQQLRETIETAVAQASKTLSQKWWLSDCEILMALAGIGDSAKEPAIIAALAEHGLRPGMPLEELFVYDPSLTVPAEPKKLTVAEELLAFGKKTVEELALKEQALGGPPPNPDPFISTGDLAFMLRGTANTTMIELMYFFATLPQQYWDRAPSARDSFLRWARMELSDEAFAGIMNMNT